MDFLLFVPKKYKDGVTLSIIIAFLLPLFFSSYVQAEKSTGHGALFQLLPPESQLQGWKLDDAPQTAEGLELFSLINGGAEIYVQEGFKRAILASYSNRNGKMINLEIFEMTSSESARNIHKRKIGKQGKKVPIGEDAMLEDYYVNFRQGRFQVTLSGDDSKEETVKTILDMALMVAKRIQSFP